MASPASPSAASSGLATGNRKQQQARIDKTMKSWISQNYNLAMQPTVEEEEERQILGQKSPNRKFLRPLNLVLVGVGLLAVTGVALGTWGIVSLVRKSSSGSAGEGDNPSVTSNPLALEESSVEPGINAPPKPMPPGDLLAASNPVIPGEIGSDIDDTDDLHILPPPLRLSLSLPPSSSSISSPSSSSSPPSSSSLLSASSKNGQRLAYTVIPGMEGPPALEVHPTIRTFLAPKHAMPGQLPSVLRHLDHEACRKLLTDVFLLGVQSNMPALAGDPGCLKLFNSLPGLLDHPGSLGNLVYLLSGEALTRASPAAIATLPNDLFSSHNPVFPDIHSPQHPCSAFDAAPPMDGTGSGKALHLPSGYLAKHQRCREELGSH